MKNVILSLIFLVGLTGTSYSQHSVRVNALSIISGFPGLTYEYKIKEKIGLNLEAAARLYKFDWNDFGYDGKLGYRFTPSVRYYFLNGEKTAGFNLYLGAFYQYRTEFYDSQEEIWQDTITLGFQDTKTTLQSQTAGIVAGLRWTSEKKIFFEFGFRYGVHFIFDERTTYQVGEDYILRDKYYPSSNIPRMHAAINLSIGYRL